MASGVGKSPFSGGSVDVRNQSEVEMLRKGHRQRMNRSALHSRGEEKRGRVVYNDQGLAQSSGYWKKPARPGMKELTDSLGNRYYTPDVIDWDDWVDMFGIHPEGKLTEQYKAAPDKRREKQKSIGSLADWCNWSFDRKDSSYDSFSCPEGHIERIDYNNSSKIMRVEFRGSGKHPVRATVCYFYVPEEVYDTLKELSKGMPTRIGYGNVHRHLVGIYFWDLIRVRGTIHGNRYECCYSASGEGGGLRKVQGGDTETAARMLEETASGKMGIAHNLSKDGQHEASALITKSAREDAAMAAEIYKRGRQQEAKASFNARIRGLPDTSGLYKSPAFARIAMQVAKEAKAKLDKEKQ